MPKEECMECLSACVCAYTFVKQRKRVCPHAFVFSDRATLWKSVLVGATGSKVSCTVFSLTLPTSLGRPLKKANFYQLWDYEQATLVSGETSFPLVHALLAFTAFYSDTVSNASLVVYC